jgi:ribosome-binding protein aMBF1 (putative translation factor)
MGTPTGDGLPRLPGVREAAERRRQVVRRLAGARQEQGLSQTIVAARMGTSQSVVARLESGTLDMRLSTLERYAAALGLELVLDVDEPRRQAPDDRS